MLRSVFGPRFGRFRTVFDSVFEQTVTTSRHVTRHLKLLSSVAIVGGSIFVALGAEDFATDQARIYEEGEQINATPPSPPMLTSQAVNNKAIDKNMADLVEQTVPAVVYIERSFNDLGEMASGTGFFINKEGLILTSAHVVGDHKTVTVLTTDDRSHLGVVESSDRNIDLSLVRIQADTTTKEFPIIRLGDSSKMRRNDFVMVIGYPGICDPKKENKNSFMTGVISSGPLSSDVIRYQLDETKGWDLCLFPRGIKVIRSNILGYHGASGAPLINQNGEAVGVLFAGLHNYDKKRPDERLYSLSISVPSNRVKKFLAEAKMKEQEWVSLCLCQGGTSHSNFDYFLWSEGSI